DDISGETSLEGTRAIAQLVQQKSVAIAPELLNCLLSLRIKQIDSGEKDKEKEALMSKKYQLKKERKSKKSQKYDKQLKKLEQELKEVEAAQNQSTKLKLNTQTMKHAFTTYFRVIRRMPKSALLTPVLEGLSKFAHLINVEFFDDLISSMHHLVEQGDLKPLDSLHCINTVFVILSGEGQALNIDPYRFYRSIYSLLPRIALEKNANQQRRQAALALRTLEIMLNVRRRQVSIGRVAAFIKRMALLCFALRTDVLISFLAALRTYFVAHPRLSEQLLDAETQDAGRYLAAVEDPDHCNAQSATIIDEMTALAMHPDITVRQFALHIRHKLPSLGNHRLQPSVATKKPWTWPKEDMAGDDDEALPFADAITFGKKRKNAPLLSISVCARIEAWLQEKK
uniref:CCAAT-binding factor domain-containing protein n=1 Tax=Plectus sambesii TaxID=2011161 RepID=A0A914WRV0_9BILA